MTDLDKLKAAQDALFNLWNAIPEDYIPNNASDWYGTIADFLVETREAHLDAQRQGGVSGDVLDAIGRIDGRFSGDGLNYGDVKRFMLEWRTIRAAHLAAQGGVPGDVVEKVGDTLRQCQTLFGFDLQHMIKMGDDYNQSVADVAVGVHNTLTLLQPYLNNGRGGK